MVAVWPDFFPKLEIPDFNIKVASVCGPCKKPLKDLHRTCKKQRSISWKVRLLRAAAAGSLAPELLAAWGRVVLEQ